MADKEKKSKVKRVFSIISTVISAILFVFVALLLVNMIVCRSQNRPVNFFGYSFSVVQTPSMEDTIMTGDLIVFKEVDYSSLQIDDIIVFKADENFKDGNGNSLQGYTIVHRIIEITQDGLVTKGDNNFAQDGGFRTADDIYGLCIANSAGWGKIFSFISKYGILIIIFMIAVPIIVSQSIKLVKLSKQKKEEEAAEGADSAGDKQITETTQADVGENVSDALPEQSKDIQETNDDIIE
ncbi:MAG: signal peptidase I [Candidatus Coproplasma sp.]